MNAIVTKYLSPVKTDCGGLRQIFCPPTLSGMDLTDKPFGDIAERLRWHRDLMGMTQEDYAARINSKRAAINNWESGDYRLSLNGALALRRAFGLSLDFMYEGIDDALPMTLRNAWRERPRDI